MADRPIKLCEKLMIVLAVSVNPPWTPCLRGEWNSDFHHRATEAARVAQRKLAQKSRSMFHSYTKPILPASVANRGSDDRQSKTGSTLRNTNHA